MSEGRTIVYARVSTDDQDLSLQLDALTPHGGPEPLTFADKLSGAKSQRPGLDMCPNLLKPGDTLAVCRLDRLGRSMRHLVTPIEDLRERGVGFRSISDGMIDTTSASGELIFHIGKYLVQPCFRHAVVLAPLSSQFRRFIGFRLTSCSPRVSSSLWAN